PMLVANVGEEGEGNLSGMRYLCRPVGGARPRAFLVLDGPSTDHITSEALASRRFDVTITGPGGHSWRDHGMANPVHAICQAVNWFTEQAAELEASRTTSDASLRSSTSDSSLRSPTSDSSLRSSTSESSLRSS